MNPSEPDRSTALDGLEICYTPAEERLDRITRVVQRVFNVPVALISLVNKDYQWFKSAQGTPLRETARTDSFCSYVVAGQEMLIVPDTLLDERFKNTRFVAGEPFIRFYAGQPLRTSEGYCVGTLCAIDTQPREFSPDQMQSLKDLAMWAENELRITMLSQVQRELIHETQELRRRSMLDPLLNIWNRSAIDEVLRREVAQCSSQKRVALVMLDVDHFKSINDTFGHRVGDQVLAEIAGVIRGSIRPSDALGRYGGEEFMVVMGDCRMAQAEMVGERIRRSIADRVINVDEHKIRVTASLGIATADNSAAADLPGFVAAADQAMYRAKAAGRNRVECV